MPSVVKEKWAREAGSRSWLCSSHVGEFSPLPPKGNKRMWFSAILGFGLFLVSSSLSTAFSTKAGCCWWVQILPWWLWFVLCAVCLSIGVLTQTSVSCSLCCSWTWLFLSLSPQALPAPLSRGVGHGGGFALLPASHPAAHQLSAAQDEPLPPPLWKGAAPTDHTVFPGAAVFYCFSGYSLLLVADSRWLSRV